MTRGRIFYPLVLACALLAPLTASAQAPAPVDVTFGINAPGAANWIFYVAQTQGYFRDENLHVTTVTSGTPTNTINLLASGGVALALDGTDVLIEAIVHGLPVKIVAPSYGPSPYVLVTSPSITSWSQLKGKTVLLGPKGDISSITFTLLAKSQHLALEDFSIVPGSTSSARYAAVLSGHVAATVLSQPFSVLAPAKGMHVLAVASQTVKDWADNCFAVNTNWAAAYHVPLVRTVHALRRALAYAYAHRDGAVAALVAATNIDPETAAQLYDADFVRSHAFDPNQQIDAKGVEFMARIAKEYGLIDSVPSLSDIVDTSIVREAARAGR